MKIGSVFSGIGGLDLGLESSGLGRVAWQIEKDPLCLKILSRHWPKAQRIHDVKEAGRSNLLPVDLICGGFPCEDLSSLGKRAGLEGARSGLWFEFFRIICELSPIAVVVENVTSGERSWLPQVRHDLVSIGYSTLLPARASKASQGADRARLGPRPDHTHKFSGRSQVFRSGDPRGDPHPARLGPRLHDRHPPTARRRRVGGPLENAPGQGRADRRAPRAIPRPRGPIVRGLCPRDKRCSWLTCASRRANST